MKFCTSSEFRTPPEKGSNKNGNDDPNKDLFDLSNFVGGLARQGHGTIFLD